MDGAQAAGRKSRQLFIDEFKGDAVRLIIDERYTFKSAAEAWGITGTSYRPFARI